MILWPWPGCLSRLCSQPSLRISPRLARLPLSRFCASPSPQSSLICTPRPAQLPRLYDPRLKISGIGHKGMHNRKERTICNNFVPVIRCIFYFNFSYGHFQTYIKVESSDFPLYFSLNSSIYQHFAIHSPFSFATFLSKFQKSFYSTFSICI